MAQEDRTALAHRVLVAVEEGLAKAQRDREWFRVTKEKRLVGTSRDGALETASWYDGMIAEQTVIIDAYRAVLGEPWAVSSDELPDLAAGDHFAGMDEDRPPADSNREGEPAFNGAWARCGTIADAVDNVRARCSGCGHDVTRVIRVAWQSTPGRWATVAIGHRGCQRKLGYTPRYETGAQV